MENKITVIEDDKDYVLLKRPMSYDKGHVTDEFFKVKRRRNSKYTPKKKKRKK